MSKGVVSKKSSLREGVTIEGGEAIIHESKDGAGAGMQGKGKAANAITIESPET